MCPLSYKNAFSLLETPFFGVLFLKTAYIEPILRFYMKQLCSYLYLCEVGGYCSPVIFDYSDVIFEW